MNVWQRLAPEHSRSASRALDETTSHLRAWREKCYLCRHDQHHVAFCRRAASAATATYVASHKAPTIDAQKVAAPATQRGAPTTTTKATSQSPAARATSRREPSVPASDRMRRTCAFCQRDHWSMKCTTYASVNQRLGRARKLELCFICLRQGHHASGCPINASPCRHCSAGSHHQALCHRPTTQSTGVRVNGIHQRKKRVNTAYVRVNDRDDCPPKNETICFCDASTCSGRRLSTSADATNFVGSFRPATEVKRVIFWFSSDRAFLSHVELVRLFTELSQYYMVHYETILQYVVVSPSVCSRQDVWTYGIFEYLVQAEVLLLDARPTMLPHDLLVRDASERQAIDTEQSASLRHH
ncbi:Pao retrotransposon peptidase family protein [Aphelenchoides avenae]|nr:Pao retrotransposon peptidase family protein [Aphelenchus avenae]